MQLREIWCDIPGYDGIYQVSNYGNVKSCQRIVPSLFSGSQKVSERILKQSTDKGYKRVTLSYMGKTFRKSVHFFVATCFVKNPDKKPHINHIDGDKSNNCASNLEWCTPSENERHSYAKLGKVNHNRKLSNKDVEFIIANAIKGDRYAGGGNIGTLANMFSVDRCTIHNIINRKYYVQA